MALIADWKQGWKFYSTWALALLAVLPDAYNAILAAGLLNAEDMPDVASWAIRIVAVLGIVSRFVSQTRPDAAPPVVDS